jgi:hypothetical protein
VLLPVQWETPLSDDMYEEALRVEMALVSRLLDEWLEQAAVAHA